ncbi:maltooligosyltrehalose trehalohydrolase [Palleronia marisminoris]|uniref:Malto-oligosyltrehalose trehalohydrolase n=1 Tax=Palleronia marisminoris TaxID=315423 RepID=A0A1Y5TI83_9RHOB|nr:malto-oligosyltrehalose trehalohydrolase [Palleronia marisminoris]SFH32782.1 maltooligosyltrehalose trehalohydrolase [Palleronia marisminoris]SLN60961.1 Malto-oligosyltrehalose trehalohydrolase [Palleronia marisminoris]
MRTFSHRWGATRNGDRWRVATWAPKQDDLLLRVGTDELAMSKEADGWHVADVSADDGTEYAFIAQGETYPDPASRWQAGDVHAASRLCDPASLPRADWHGRPWEEAVVLEIHVGTFTADGTLRAAAERMEEVAALGITAIELMPLAQFAGDRGWGYDGVLPNALHPAYGTPADLVAFVDAAHAAGIMVLVDAVYNHFGPDGAYIHALCPSFFDDGRQTPWGAAIDFTRPEVRAFFLQNAEMWIAEYGVDGLRLDAVHQIGQPDETDFLRELADHVAGLDLGRPVHLVAEDERNLASYVGHGALRAQWNDDYHHAVHVLMTGEDQSYYAPFSDDPFGDMLIALRDGQVDQGQPRPRTDETRGEPSDHLPPQRFVNSNQTHDQIGNRAVGERLIALTSPEDMRVMHAMLCLSPFIPMLFQGEEIGSRAPFQFFTDFHGDLAGAVRKGRRDEFPEFADARDEIPDPNAPETFERSKPYASPPPDADEWRDLTRRCLKLRVDRVVPLLKSGWQRTEATREGDRSLRAAWTFAAGRLEITFADGEPAPALSTPEILTMEGPRVALHVGLEGN